MAFNIDTLHSEITAFLRNLNLFFGNENLTITDKTIELLEHTILAIDRLVASAEISSHSGINGSDFVFQLDKDHFELRRHIMCRLCLEQISMEENDVKAHQMKLTHAQHLKRMQQNQLGLIEPYVENANPFSENDNAMKPAEQNGHNTIANQMTLQHETDIFSNDFDELSEDDKNRKGTKEAFTKSAYAPIGFNFDDSLYLIKMSGIPWTATKTELQVFLSEVNILNGIKGIHFMIDEKKCSINQAYIQLETRKDYSVSKSYNNATMDGVYVKVMEGDIYDFMKMVTLPDYPENRRVIRLKNVPNHCNESAIKAFFPGLCVRSVYFARVNDRLEAFVKFQSCEDVESSLNIMGKKINDVYVKIYRSSEEQIRMVFTTQELSRSQLSLQSIEQAPKGRSSNSACGEFTVLARGYAWTVTKEAIREFFRDVNIVNGEEGISLYKNGAMETRFDVVSNLDMQKALAQNGERMGARIIAVFKAI